MLFFSCHVFLVSQVLVVCAACPNKSSFLDKSVVLYILTAENERYLG